MIREIAVGLTAITLAVAVTTAVAAPTFNKVFDLSVLENSQPYYSFVSHRINAENPYGVQMQIFIGIPKKAVPTAGFPVLYALDGNILLESLTAERLKLLSEKEDSPVVVLIGYNTANWSEAVKYRSYDYTPPCKAGDACRDSIHPERQGGGADKYFNLIEKDVKAYVATQTKIDKDRETLLGHSYGGLFVLHTMFEHPESFDNFIAADPSIWWQQPLMFDEAKAFLAKKPDGEAIQLWVMKSGLVKKRASDEKERRVMETRKIPAGASANFFKALDESPAIDLKETKHPNHHHGRLLPDSLMMALDLPTNY